MKHKRILTILAIIMATVAAITTSFGIFSGAGSGSFTYESIRGDAVEIYGRGIYAHMSADVAIQGIAQDIVTLVLGIPLLLLSIHKAGKGSLRSLFFFAGTSLYFFVSFLFYTAMAMYNIMFLGYVILLGTSFFALVLSLDAIRQKELQLRFSQETPVKFIGGFLMFNSVIIALLWLGVIVPPLLDGSVYPPDLEHYTTLIVQGFDLGLLLPIGFIAGWLLYRRTASGLLIGTTYMIFLCFLMSALSAKIVTMAIQGVNVIPAVFVIPVINTLAILCAILLLKNVKEKKFEEPVLSDAAEKY